MMEAEKMKTIITVKADEKEIKVSIDGSNIDILTGVVNIIEAMEQSGSDMARGIALDYINGYLAGDEELYAEED